MGILDAAVHLGAESTYGTPAALTRSFEAKDDDFEREHEYLSSVGARAGMQGERSDRQAVINMGGKGSLDVDFLNKGMGLVVQGLLGTTTGPTQVSGTIAYSQVHATSKDGPSTSYTIQWIRPTADAATQQFTHKGCVVTGWSLAQEVGEYLRLKADYDFQDVDTTTAAGTAVYPASTEPFHWGQAVVNLGGSPVDMRSLGFEADLGFKLNRRYLRGSVLKKQPRRQTLPTYGGNLKGDFESMTRYLDFVNGTVLALQVVWTGGLIVSGQSFTVTLDCPAIQFRGNSPHAQRDDLSNIDLPFKVLDNGANPMVSLTLKSTDTAL